VLFLDEGRSYRFDNRARRVVCSLRDAGAKVTVVCPAYPGEPLREVMDGDIECFRFRSVAGEFKAGDAPGAGVMGHLLEYARTIPLMAVITARLFVSRGFDVIHAVNPPDLLFAIAAPYRLLGRKWVFDHYDLNPELFEDRFEASGAQYLLPLVRCAEKLSIRLADHVITTNESYRSIATSRAGKDPARVTVVRNGPDQRRFRPLAAKPEVRALGDVVIGYLGNMNPQDGLDHFVEMARILRHDRGRTDLGFVLVGSGDSTSRLLQLRSDYGLEECMMLPGRLPADEMVSHLCAADICVQPDPPGRLNNVSTMNKAMEYMALGKAVVSYDLPETRVTGGDIIRYVQGGQPEGLADAVLQLANDPQRRHQLGSAGLERVTDLLGWQHQVGNLVSVYEKLFPGRLDLEAAQAACAMNTQAAPGAPVGGTEGGMA
jgi:glycosyltransferase involved in cell wall biosynthesis